MTYQYKQPLKRIGADDGNSGSQPSYGDFRSPSKQAIYPYNEQSMEEIQMTEADGEPG